MEEVLSLLSIPFECVEDGIFLSASRLNIQVGAQRIFSVFLDLFSFACHATKVALVSIYKCRFPKASSLEEHCPVFIQKW